MSQATAINYEPRRLSQKKQRALYREMLKPRMIEEKMLKLLRQGRISKWFSGIGQEAISVGCTMALDPDEMIFTMHRNLGVFTAREVPLLRLFAQWQGKEEGFTNGRDRSFHFGAPEFNITGMISHLGPQLALADGVALAHKLKGESKVALAFTGEGGTSEGDFHEALNVASVWELPVIFIIENNGYGLSTPVNEQYNCEKLADRGIGYGMEAVTIDGNNILEVYRTVARMARKIRKRPRPVLIECETFRMRGHEEASGVKYVPEELLEAWAKKDPLENFRQYLYDSEILDEETEKEYREKIQSEIDNALASVFELPEVTADTSKEVADLFMSYQPEKIKPRTVARSEKRMIDAISAGLYQAMEQHENLILMGQDIAEYGGVFKITEGFVDAFGKDRVRNTPLCESAIIGAALGLSMKGFKSMVEMQFADFVTCGFNQIVNNLAKIHYRWGQNADVVIRMPTGAGVGAGPFHSQSNEAWFFHVPGLRIVYPSGPEDAKGLLTAAIEDPNPYLFFEHKALYRSVSEPVPDDYYTLPSDKANLVRSGNDASVITYGMGVHWALKYAREKDLNIDILDLRSLAPLDWEAIRQSIEKTSKVIVLHEDNLTGGIGAEIAAWITQNCFEYLDGPVMRAGSLDTPVPFAKALEENYLPEDRFRQKLDHLLAY